MPMSKHELVISEPLCRGLNDFECDNHVKFKIDGPLGFNKNVSVVFTKNTLSNQNIFQLCPNDWRDVYLFFMASQW